MPAPKARSSSAGADQTHKKPRLTHWAGAGALVAICFLAYIPAMDAGFIWDDEDYITRNFALRDVDGLRQIWFEFGAVPQYYPLVHTTFWIEYHLWGFDPSGYHIINISLHAIGAVLLYLLLGRLKIPGGWVAAWFAAAVFAVHPVHVESVAWVTERKNVLSAALYFAAMLAYLRFNPFDLDDGRDGARRRWKFYAVSFGLYVAALLSKTVTCSFPAAILLLTWWKRGRLTIRDVAPTIPMFIVGLAGGAITAWMEKYHVGAQGEEWSLSLVERFVLAGRIAWFYVFKLVAPINLMFVYPRWDIDATQLWQWLFTVSAVAVVATLFAMRHRIGRGPLVSVLFFGGTLFPALGFFDVYPFRFSFVADHFQHLASLGVTVLIVCVIAHPALRLGAFGRMSAGVAGVCIIAVLGALTWRQCRMYKDLETLWTVTLAKNPGSYMPHYNYGFLLFNQGRFPEALEQFRLCLASNPRYVAAHSSIGQTLIKLGQREDAMPHFLRALEIDPGYPYAHNNIGWLFAEQGRYDEAIERYTVALTELPQFVAARNNLGNALLAKGDVAGAIEQFRTALTYDPDDAMTHSNLSMALARQGDSAGAIEHLRAAVELRPHIAELHFKLGAALAAAGRWDEAWPSLTRAVELARAAGNEAAAQSLESLLQQYRERAETSATTTPAASP
jgi:tetratricopeptide (TPR) repeat protein